MNYKPRSDPGLWIGLGWCVIITVLGIAGYFAVRWIIE